MLQLFPSNGRFGGCQVARLRNAARVWPAAGIAVLSGIAAVEPAEASGYALREQSASALGNAFAGANASAEDISYMFFNPASLTQQTGSQILGVGNVIMPQMKIRNPQGSNARGVAIGGNDGGQDVGEDAFVPVLYGLWDLQQSFDLQQNIKLGLGVNVPFGVETDYRDGWVGRYYALHSKVEAINVNPAIAWEAVDGLSLAAGLQVQYIDARLTNAIDFGSIAGVGPTQRDGRGKVDGDDVGYGFNLGVLWEPWDGTRFGASYRSAVHHTIDGDANFSLGGPVGQAVANATGAFRDTGMRTNVTTPETVGFGVHQEVSPQWAVMANAEWTRWSRFHDLTIKYDNSRQPNTVTNDDWQDTWFLATGAEYRPDEAWRLRAGVAWDQDPTRNSHRTPRIPTNNRWWLSFGAGWNPMPNLTLDAGYTHIFFEDGSINLNASDPGNARRGNLTGTTEGNADILALSAKWVF